MDRSFAGRLGIGSLSGPPMRKKARRTGGGPGRRGPARHSGRLRRGEASAIDLAIAHALQAPVSLARALGVSWRYVRVRKRLRIALIAALIATPLLGGGWLWLRDSSLVAVEHVRVSGVHGPKAQAVKAALTSTAQRMSTLDFSTAKLRASVAAYPVV